MRNGFADPPIISTSSSLRATGRFAVSSGCSHTPPRDHDMDGKATGSCTTHWILHGEINTEYGVETEHLKQ